MDFHLQKPCSGSPVRSVMLLFLLYPTSIQRANSANWVIKNYTVIAITRKDWMSKLMANPFENQNMILRILARMRTAQVSIEKEPICLRSLIRAYWE